LLVVLGPYLRIGNGDPRQRIGDAQHHDRDFAILRGAEEDLSFIEIARQFLGGGWRDLASLLAVKHDIIDGPLLPLVTVDEFGHGFRRCHLAGDGLGKLAPQRDAALLGGVPAFGVASRPDDRLEPAAIELAREAAEGRIFRDPPGDLGVGESESQLSGALVECGFRDQLSQQLLVEAERPRLIGRDGTPDLSAELLQTLVVDLAELLGADLRPADLGETRSAETPEDIADAPDREAHDQKAHDNAHDGLAEPIRRGFTDTSKHQTSHV
jgi:hypothetical protein